MPVVDWILDHSSSLKDVGLLIFAGVGAVFSYLAWWQRRLEIKEKFFERRFEVFEMVSEAVSLGLKRGNTDWMPKIVEAKQRADFLFGPDVCEPLARIEVNLGDYLEANDQDVSEKRNSVLKGARDGANAAYLEFSAAVRYYLSVR